ncbi:GTP cyclohydrolase IIa [Eubacterium ventriosum]|uniref:Stage 0 sporulation protein A homolog n=1 Tax=Eubacterium ventriosum TaxID=39496 RepID=A0A415LFY2_9FIRM|nr:GTP cyclohydrolase IIa [Eubacterium ventriosum]RHL47214.1 GTP cyclohydrolase IIa [Eubacterium ventriosum]
MEKEKSMTKQETEEMMKQLEKVFSIVRILDVEGLETANSLNKGKMPDHPCQCYSFWNRDTRCANCISARVLADKKQRTKIEFIDSDMYQVISRYIEIDNVPHIIEMINCLDSDTLIDSDGRKELIGKIAGFDKEIYLDVLTGAYNRKYYEDNVKMSTRVSGIAMLDIDDFKLYNDTFGHMAGDVALETVVGVIKEEIRKIDLIIRYGGDEFLIVMPGIEENSFVKKIRHIREKIDNTKVSGYPELKLSVSIGGVVSDGRPIEYAIDKADKLMYKAKIRKNMVVTENDINEGNNNTSEVKRFKILIIDDSEKNRGELTEMLEREFDVINASDAKQGIEMINKYGEDIALLLLEVKICGMSGFEVLTYMKHSGITENIPVIIISDEKSESFIRRAYDLGAVDYIGRPFDFQTVYTRVLNTIKLYAKQRRLEKLVARNMVEKEKNNRMLIGVLEQVIEYRNGESGIHVSHIKILTEMLLDKLMQKTDKYNLSWSQRMMIITASALHDIGKVGIEEKIINKTEKLTEEESNEMKMHTLIGAGMIENLDEYKDEELMQIAYGICREHHERYDGKGYPDGLKGDDIPIGAQVVALADEYDRLVMGRPNKKSVSHEQAVNMIKDRECRQFNPILVECFLEISDEIKARLQ